MKKHQKRQIVKQQKKPNLTFINFSILAYLASLIFPHLALSQPMITSVDVIVNSNEDGAITPDDKLTLREAISLVNGTLKIEQLSNFEKTQINTTAYSRIRFNLPPEQTTIYLQEVLPPLASPGLLVDGTSQPGYNGEESPTAEIKIPQPIVSITPADNAEVFRGLTITADNITVRGLSIYGFNSSHRDTASTPPADIFIANTFTHPHTIKLKSFVGKIPETENNPPPQNIIIEKNWLGIKSDGTMPENTSAFGISVFNSERTIIERNRISYHDGSGIITGWQATKMQIINNLIIGNGLAGIPDAIRLDGNIDKSEIKSNLICANDGSGIYAFKPQGSTKIFNNEIKYNGRRFRRAAVYLMGNDHEIYKNKISYQAGAGVVITSYPQSHRNIIDSNRFHFLEGLSIDLNHQHNTGVGDFQNGDGPNPLRDSANRRLDTANGAINSPRFLSSEFFSGITSQVGIDGVAEPNAQVDIYRITGKSGYGFLSEPLARTTANNQGKFSFNLDDLQPGDRVSAIATIPQYGTSEPSYPAVIRPIDINKPIIISNKNRAYPPSSECLISVVGIKPPIKPPEVSKIPNAPIKLKVPKNIHFALDKYNISPASAKILDKIAQVLRENPSIIVEIYGHTDYRASNQYNIRLGANRAKATRNYLIRQGITPERMIIRSLGETELLTPGNSKLDHARNRRSEFIFKDIRGIEVIVQEEDLQLE
ncbi:OmpA family protein [Anabaena sp. UHCC 0204]|uniref:OmpA family protein n=1 Tax=Anabaena sp. UHCC 0204 TaxID=2590009 RepID=UPI00144696DF|nr:OmpA family protein [Anabaena sp. UHCC 0204]MTJ09227.1 OmpA family protein [Anabaena sp. UHCC 0204]